VLGHGAKFEHKREQAIAALLTHRNVEAAAHAVGISVTTLLRWMKDPEFQAAYQEARRTVFAQTLARLQDAAGAAVTTVLKVMLDPNAPAGTRLRAAEIVLEQAVRTSELEDIVDRLSKLERATATKSRKRPAGLTLVKATSLPGPGATPPLIAGPAPDGATTDKDVLE
jgi:hypothetical protein